MSDTYWQWRVLESGKWRTLRWRMTEEDALKWSEGRPMEKVPNSAEARTNRSGQGWGQFVPPAPGKDK